MLTVIAIGLLSALALGLLQVPRTPLTVSRSEAVRRVLRHIARRPIAQLADADAAVVRGEAVAVDDPLVAPLSGRRCIGYHLLIRDRTLGEILVDHARCARCVPVPGELRRGSPRRRRRVREADVRRGRETARAAGRGARGGRPRRRLATRTCGPRSAASAPRWRRCRRIERDLGGRRRELHAGVLPRTAAIAGNAHGHLPRPAQLRLATTSEASPGRDGPDPHRKQISLIVS